MSTDASAPLWEPLSLLERRILGVLVEKQKTSKSSDSYPLSLNSLTTGCNQKSNRDPVLDLDEVEVEEGLAGLQKKGLAVRLTGGRVDRFKHELYEKWTPHGAQMAVVAELLLRGPQTKGELRIRASRMDPIETLEALEDVLKPLFERGLVVALGDPHRRGAQITHGFHAADELEWLRSHQAAGLALGEVAAPRPAALPGEPENLKSRVAALEAQVAEIRKQLGLESTP
jgi:uncharacterized protein YceH (UPF0502 family)